MDVKNKANNDYKKIIDFILGQNKIGLSFESPIVFIRINLQHIRVSIRPTSQHGMSSNLPSENLMCSRG